MINTSIDTKLFTFFEYDRTVNKMQKKLILIMHELSKDTDKGSELGRMMLFVLRVYDVF